MTTAAATTTTTTGVGKRNNKQVSVQDQKQHGCSLQNDGRCIYILLLLRRLLSKATFEGNTFPDKKYMPSQSPCDLTSIHYFD